MDGLDGLSEPPVVEEVTSGVQIQEAPLQENYESPHEDEIQEGSSPVNNETDSNSNSNSKNTEEESDESYEDSLLLGDRILIESRRYGRTLGMIYFIDESLIRVLPDGVSDRLYDFPIEDGVPDPELGVTTIEVEEGPRLPFVDLVGLRSGSTIDTFQGDGTPIGIFTIKNVDVSSDSAIVVDENEDETLLEFNFRGIPRDSPFDVLRIAPEAAVEVKEEEKEGESEEEKEEKEGEEEDDFLELGFIELPVIQQIIEIARKDRIYPDASQKGDLLADLLSMLDRSTQKNPQVIKYLRSVVEMFHTLKLQSSDKKLSFETLSDILDNRNVPLARPVLTTKRVLILNYFDDYTKEDKETDQIIMKLYDPTFKNLNKYIETYGGLQNTEVTDVGISTWHRYLNGFFNDFPLGDVYKGSSYSFPSDGEYLRQEVPPTRIEGISHIGFGRDNLNSDTNVGDVSFSLRRGLGPTFVKKGLTETRIVSPGDSADSKYHILFPLTVASSLGATRSGSLLKDILRSHAVHQSLKDIFNSVGNPSDEPSSQNILLLRAEDATLANIQLTDYLNVVLKSLTPRGVGDLLVLLNDLGMLNKEFTVEQQEVINNRVKEVVLLLRGLIRSLRSQTETPTPNSESFSGQTYYNTMKELISEQPILAELYNELRQRTPGYATTDLGILGMLLVYAQDYAMAVLGRNATSIQKERIRATRDMFRQTLLKAQKARVNELEKGAPPEVNPCPHVKALSQVRRISDDSERLALLTKFIDRYQGGREDNWLTCIVCDQHLICQHELLQIQQYLHSREFDSLQKQIVLHFAGGTFGAKNICRNCGIPIGDIEFDRNIEFDDEGRPLNGRGVIVDQDAIEEENIEQQLGAPVGNEPEITFETPEKTMIYQTTRELCDRIGVFVDSAGYKNIVNRVNVQLLSFPSRARYEAAQKGRAKGSAVIDYDVYLNRFLIGLIGGCLLVEIQSKIPDYVVRYTVPGCRPGFDGFPLYPNADPASPNDSVGIHYIACAINGISKQSGPFFLTGWQKERSDEKRQGYIVKAIISSLQTFIVNDPVIQGLLEKKRDYQKEVFGKQADTGRPSEKLPPRFAPPIESDSESLRAQVEHPVVPEATGQKASKTIQSLNWIRIANSIAKQSAHIEANSPFTETGCCYTDIGNPHAFWNTNAAALPPLPPHTPISFAFGRQTWFFVPYVARSIESVEVEIPFDLAYKIFARLCYKGPRVGLPHELGYDGKCDWCDTEIPIEVLLPDVDKYGKSTASDSILLDSFTSQGIEITRSSFEELLNASHNRYIFDSYRPQKPLDAGALITKTSSISPQPLIAWKERVMSVMEKVSKLKGTATRVEVAETLSELTSGLEEAEMTVRSRIGQEAFDILLSISRESAGPIFEVLKAAFVIPIQRIYSNYNTNSLSVHSEYKLSRDHQDDIRGILEKHISVLTSTNTNELGDYGMKKYEFYIQQMSGVLELASEIRATRIPYGEILLPYIMRVFIFGPIADLVDPNKFPGSELSATSSLTEAGRASVSIQKTVRALIKKMNEEKLSYSPELIREKMAQAKQKENDATLDEFDKKSDEDRAIELVKKKLGIGRWAIGGSKLIWSYNADQYDKEREARLKEYNAAGETLNGVEPLGRPTDALGMTDYGQEYTEREGGYEYTFYDTADAE